MSDQLAIQVCNALEGKKVDFSFLSASQKDILKSDLQKNNFMNSLKMVMNIGDTISSEIQIRLNKAVARKDIEKRAVPVTGM